MPQAYLSLRCYRELVAVRRGKHFPSQMRLLVGHALVNVPVPQMIIKKNSNNGESGGC